RAEPAAGRDEPQAPAKVSRADTLRRLRELIAEKLHARLEAVRRCPVMNVRAHGEGGYDDDGETIRVHPGTAIGRS
ncbi:hypothetical protein, partial [Bifidobacterium reuteri]|uniref:hypothetical protein n=1 Tax=Bifidobacterium reuteri TaxID=983706 RepID=UPI001EE75B9F